MNAQKSRDRVRVRAPATSANLGPGFDAAGLALDWWDTLEATPGEAPSFQVSGGHAEGLPTGPGNLVLEAMEQLAREVGRPLPPASIRVEKGFPLGRGFGSSAAAVVLGLLAARALVAPELTAAELLTLATAAEGHPDNVAPCLLGGATVSWVEEGRARAAAVPLHPDLAAVALVAPAPMSTTAARRILPAEVPFADAARTAGRSALLPLALSGAFDLLLPATADVLHQPHRLAQVPAAARALEQLRRRGHAAVLSGAGPSLLVLTPREALAGALADAAAAVEREAGWRVQPLEVAAVGALGAAETGATG